MENKFQPQKRLTLLCCNSQYLRNHPEFKLKEKKKKSSEINMCTWIMMTNSTLRWQNYFS